MKQITINLYTCDELEPKAFEKAHRAYAEAYDDPLLQAHLGNLVMEELDARGVKYEASSINAMYSLAHCQGDGLMFEGYMTYKGHDVKVKHSGHYYHEYSRIIDITDENGEEADQHIYTEFESLYKEVCLKVRDAGYAEIEYQQSEEAFREACEANEYTFEADGTMRNA